jgi:hypothetical protein
VVLCADTAKKHMPNPGPRRRTYGATFISASEWGRRETEPLSAALVKNHLPVQLELALNHIAYQRYVRHHTTRKQLVHLRCLSLLQFKSKCIFFLIESCELCLQVLHARTFTVACPPNSLREYPRLSESTAVSPFPQLLHHPPAVL